METAFQLRLGLVMYGGSSLAVYMGGMTRELLAVVRAAQVRKALQGTPSLSLREWAIREVAANPYCGLLEHANVDVIIDVIAGTSAGGLNGLLLAKALAVGAPDLGDLTDSIWREKADLEALARFDADPKSVLSGDYLYHELMRVLQAIGAAGRPELGDLVKVLDLFITATDVRGHDWTRWDRFNQKLQGQSHKYLFHLRKRTRQGGGLRGYACNDFTATERAAVDVLLAKIGRATSAIPGVFPPMRISRGDARAAGVDVLGDLGAVAEEGIWFSDGGMLVNAPFEPVLDTISQRAANQPVRRLLLFLEPDPSTETAPPQTEPSMLEAAVAGITLPMQQEIFDTLERLREENQRRRRLMELLKGLEGAGAGLAPGTYLQLRLNRLRQVLDAGLTRALEGLGLREAGLRAAVALLTARLMPAAGAAPEDPPVVEALERYDAEYHSRRLHYLLGRLHEHAGPGSSRLLDRLWGALEDWHNALWVVAHAGRLGAQPERWQALTTHLDQAMTRFARAMSDGAPPAKQAAAADAAALALARYADSVHAATAEEIWHALDEADGSLRQAFHGFTDVDRILFPIEIGAGRGAWGEIGLYGFRPNAARSWVTKCTAEKLAGEALGHFAAFLDARWRANDLMWGRLDAAELIFRMIAQEAGLCTEGQPLPPKLDECLLKRRRQILAAYPDLIDFRRLQALTLGRPPEPPAPPALSIKERLSGAWQFATQGRVAPGLLPAPAAAPFSLDQVPGDVLREYLMRFYKVGQEGIDALPAGRLAGELLLMLDNAVTALGRPAPSALAARVQQVLAGVMRPLGWVARLVLLPQRGLVGLVQSNLVPLMTLMGGLLLVAWATGALTLTGGGKVLLAALFAPLLADLLIRPTAVKVALLALPAVLTGAAAVLGPGLPWAALLARVWAPFAVVFAAAALAWWSNRRWRRRVRKMKQGAGA